MNFPQDLIGSLRAVAGKFPQPQLEEYSFFLGKKVANLDRWAEGAQVFGDFLVTFGHPKIRKHHIIMDL